MSGLIGRIGSLLLGRRLANREQSERRLGAFEGLPAMGLDGLGSSAYGPEAALTVLRAAGAASLAWIGWIMTPIVCGAFAASLHSATVSRHSGFDRHSESARDSGCGPGVCVARLRVRGKFRRRDWSGTVRCSRLRRASSACDGATETTARNRSRKHSGRRIAVLIPQLIKLRWYQYLLHLDRGRKLRSRLLKCGDPHLVVIDVPLALDRRAPEIIAVD